MSDCAPFHFTKTPLARGVTLIEASAGTGKTYAITCLLVRLIVERNLSIGEILVVTYTDAATQELRDRIRQTLASAFQAFESGKSDITFLLELLKAHSHERPEMAARLQSALGGFDEAPIFTIHSFCQRTLRDRAFDSHLLFDTQLATDPSELLREIADDYWRKNFYEASPVVMQFALKNRLDPDVFLRLLRTCINYPHLKFISGADGQSLSSLAEQLEAQFEKARELWLTQRKEIKACFGSAIKWGNRPYNSDEQMAPHFEDLDSCFSQSMTAFEALACLEHFGAPALAAKQNRRSKTPPPVPTHPFFDACAQLGLIEKLWLARLALDFVEEARQQMPQRKADRKIQFYDDLLTRLDAALAGPSGIPLAEYLRGRYQAALIDEFQDTDPIQYAIFRRAFGNGHTFLFMIGDPKQAIYGFRGADIFTYLQAAEEAKRRFTLGENWRSESRLVTAVNRVFSFKSKAFVFDRIEFKETIAKGKADSAPFRLDGQQPPPFQVWLWETGGEITKKLARGTLPGVVASEIVRLLNGAATIGDRKLKPEDIAILVLENRQAAEIQEALNLCRIPNVLYTTASLFDSVEAAEFGRVLAGIAAPGDDQRVRSALATDLLGVSGVQLHALDDAQWQGWLEKFHTDLLTWEDYGFFRMFRQWLRREQVRARLLGFANGERRLTNLLHLGEVLHQAENQRRLGVSGLLKWFAEQGSEENETAEEHQLRLERDENAVRIVTVHKSKGLEYPVVFCPYSWKSSEIKRGSDEQVFFHDPAQEQRLVRDLGPEIAEAHRELAKQEKLAENVRLLYVALTRAKHRCYFAWGRFKGAGTSAPSWLFHRPETWTGAVVDELDASFAALNDSEMKAHLQAMAALSPEAVEISELPEITADEYQSAAPSEAVLAAKQFTGRIRRDWTISSFTGLLAGRHEETPDYDALDAPASSPGTGIFGFPRGAKAGICLHEILERVDFAADVAAMTPLVQQRLSANALDQPLAVEAVCQMLQNVVRFPLDVGRPQMRLECVGASDRIAELEFYFPIKNLVASKLSQVLARHGWSSASGSIERVEVDPVNGFLKGFIDLVFRDEDRYYVVDWKSNWLGNSVDAYAQPALRAEMQRRHYFLQYHLYSVALHKYLALRLPGYKYEQHFGGIYYLFLRGVDPARPDCGVFHDRPAQEAIAEFACALEN